MNSTSLIEETLSVQNSIVTIVESWFIPFDIFLIICSILIILILTLFLLIIIFDKTCHTIPMLLIGNTSLSGLLMGCILLSFSIFTLRNDLLEIEYEDSLCILRAYIGYVSYTSFQLFIYIRGSLSIHNCCLSNSFIFSIIKISTFAYLFDMDL
jgi:hypothetical protein